MINLNRSYLSLSGMEVQEEKPQLISFMRKKKVKIPIAAMDRSRIKTQVPYVCETNFKFLKNERFATTMKSNKKVSERRMQSSMSRVITCLSNHKKPF